MYSTTGVPKNGVGDRSRSEPTKEAKEAVANWIVVSEEEPENKMYKDLQAGGEDVEEEHDDITEEELLSKVLVNDDLWRFLKKKPCVCSLVPSPSATSVAASAGVQHLKLGCDLGDIR